MLIVIITEKGSLATRTENGGGRELQNSTFHVMKRRLEVKGWTN
jgi:hypothetical protein